MMFNMHVSLKNSIIDNLSDIVSKGFGFKVAAKYLLITGRVLADHVGLLVECLNS